MVSISDFRHVVKFEIVVKTANASSGQVESYTNFVTVRGYMKKTHDVRAFDDGYDREIDSYELTTFWRQEIENNLGLGTKVVYDNRFFKVETWELIREQRMFYKIKLIGIK